MLSQRKCLYKLPLTSQGKRAQIELVRRSLIKVSSFGCCCSELVSSLKLNHFAERFCTAFSGIPTTLSAKEL